MNPVTASELAKIQSDAVTAVCDKTCVVLRKTTTTGATGEPLASYTTVATTVAGLAEPTAGQLSNYDFLLGSLAAWQVKLPVATSVQEQDLLSIDGQQLEAHVLLNPRSYAGLLTVLAAEIKTQSAVSTLAQYLTAILADGATHHYSLNETSGTVAHDNIGSLNGTLTGGYTLSQAAIVPHSPSVLFDGSTGYVALPTGIDPTGLAAFSMEVWFEYPTTHHGGRLLDNAHTDASNTGFQMSIDSTNGGLTSLATTGGTANLFWSKAWATNTPYLYSMSYDGTHMIAYINGVQVGSDVLTGTILSSGLPINVGRGSYNNDYCQCLAAHVAYYPLALSAAQTANHYALGVA